MCQIALEELINYILCTNSAELYKILNAVTEHFSELFPDQELLTLAVPGSNPDRQIAALQRAIVLLSTLNEK